MTCYAAKMFGKVKGLASKAKGMKMPKIPSMNSVTNTLGQVKSKLNNLQGMSNQAKGGTNQGTFK